MRFVIQTVSEAQIHCQSDDSLQSITHGLLIYVAISKTDIGLPVSRIDAIVQDLITLRCMEDDQGKINISVQEFGGSILLVSNFTLYGSNKKGKRLDFGQSASFDQAHEIYQNLYRALLNTGITCISGTFGDYMKISSTVTGPINVMLDYDQG